MSEASLNRLTDGESHFALQSSVQASIQSSIQSLQTQMHDMELRMLKSFDDKHKENRQMNEATRDSIQSIVNANFLSQQELARKVDRNATMMATVIGEDGNESGGRLGKLEKTMEQLKQFRWQALAVIAAGAWFLEHYRK